MFLHADEVAVSDAGAAASPASLRPLGRRNRILTRKGIPRVRTRPACARFKFDDGGLRELRCAADSLAIIAGSRGRFATLFLEADFPALLRKGALEALTV